MGANLPAAPTPPPPPPSPAPSTCPSCQASLAPGTRFCPQCGAAVGGGAPAAAPIAPTAGVPPPPVDIRRSIDQDRGVLKRIQLLIPGFRGYRQGEDIRAADSLLRIQVADKVHQVLAALQDTRATLARQTQYVGLTDLATVLSDLQVLEGRVRHAEQGYSGIAANVRVQPEQLDRLYEYDYGFVTAADQLGTAASAVQDASQKGDVNVLRVSVQTLRGQVQQLQNAFAQRLRAVEGILV